MGGTLKKLGHARISEYGSIWGEPGEDGIYEH